ncbi:unnamed protein product [Rotaria sp. Silwood1]|nr:unnamed protein product [Rotaria sp. Silwood1]
MRTCIEDLSTELWFIIFRFLTREHLVSAFSKLNSRFDVLLSSPHLPTIFRVKIDRCDAYPTVHSLKSSNNLKLEWIQALEAHEHVPGGYVIQFLRFQTPRLINLRSLNISIRAKHASTNLDYLSKAVSQLYSLQIFKLQCEQNHVDRIISCSLAQLFKTILQVSCLRHCTLHLWNLAEKNFDYERITNLPTNQSIEYLHVTGVDRTILFTFLSCCHRLKTFVAERNATEDMFVSKNSSYLITSDRSCPTLSTMTLSICNLRFDELENVCAYAAYRIHHLRLVYSVYVFTNHYEDYLDYFDQIRWTNLLENIEVVNIAIQIHALDDVAKDIVGNMIFIFGNGVLNCFNSQNGKLDLSILNSKAVSNINDILSLRKVKSINLSNNQIESLFGCIHTLDLLKNHLTKLPQNFRQLKSVKPLDLFKNHVTNIPLYFYDLTKLEASIGFFGIGNMGKHMATNLIAANHQVTVFDINPQAFDHFKGQKQVKIASVPQEAVANSEFIVLMLPNGKIVRDVCQSNIFPSAKKGTFIIDCSTIDIRTSKEMAELARSKQLNFVDAPVAGATIGAQKGTLIFMVGGQPNDLKAVEPILGNMGKTIVHIGANGSGAAAKICNNLLVAISMIGTSEAMNLGIKLGLNKDVLAKLINSSSGQCWSSQTYNPCPGVVSNVPSSNDYNGGFTSELMTKDLLLALDAAKQVKASTPLTEKATELYNQLCSNGLNKKDFSVIFKYLNEQ